MGKTLTTKSLKKRIRVTKNGKAIRRPMGVNHFKTRKSSNALRRKRDNVTIEIPSKKLLTY